MEAAAIEEATRGFKIMLAWSTSLELCAKGFLNVSKRESDKPRDVEAYHIQWSCDVKEIKEINGIPASLKDHFLFFSSEYYANHPWHHHSQRIKEMGDKFAGTIADLHRFCEKSFTFYEKNLPGRFAGIVDFKSTS